MPIMKQSVQPLNTLITKASPGRPPAASQTTCVCVSVLPGEKMSLQQTFNYQRMESSSSPLPSLMAELMNR